MLAPSILLFLLFFRSLLFGHWAEGNSTTCGSCSVTSVRTEARRIIYSCSTQCLSGCLLVNSVEVYEETTNSMAMNVSWGLSSQALEGSQVVTSTRAVFTPVDHRLLTNEEAVKYCYPKMKSDTYCNQGDLLRKTTYSIQLDNFASSACVTSKEISVSTFLSNSTSIPSSEHPGNNTTAGIAVSVAAMSASSLAFVYPAKATSIPPSEHPSNNTTVIIAVVTATSIPPSEHRSNNTTVVIAVGVALASVAALSAASIAFVYLWKLRTRKLQRTCSVEYAESLTGSLTENAFTVLDTFRCKSSQNAISNRQCKKREQTTESLELSDTSTRQKRLTVWLSHPTQQKGTRVAARRLAEQLRKWGIDCKSSLLCLTEIAINGFSFVEELMECADIILVCCNKEYIQAWKTTDSSNESAAFFYERHQILAELRRCQLEYQRLAVILFNDESTDCIPTCLKNTKHYKFPDKNEFFDLLHRITETEPNDLGHEEQEVEQSSLESPHQSQDDLQQRQQSPESSPTNPTRSSIDFIYITSV